MLSKNVEITLIEHSTAGNPSKVFPSQTVEIIHEPPTVQQSPDGIRAIAHHNSTIFWYSGKARDFLNITDVKIVDRDGAVLIEWPLNRNFVLPHDIPGGVKFCVLEPDN
jgi:hypothetical protein